MLRMYCMHVQFLSTFYVHTAVIIVIIIMLLLADIKLATFVC